MSPSSLDRVRRRAARVVRWSAPLLLAACAAHLPSQSVPKYVPPAAGATAKLVMRGTVPAGDVYGMYLFEDSENCKGLRSLGSGNSTRNPPTTVLAANQIQTVEFFLVKANRQYCAIRWSFTPVAGKTYLLSGGAVSATSCAARVMDASDPDHIKPELAALRRNPAAGGQCLPLGMSKAASVAGTDTGHAGQDAVLRQGATADDLKGLIAP